MRIHWHNVVIVFLAGTVLVLLVRGCSPLSAVVNDVPHIGPGHSWEEKTVGLIVLGFIGLCLVAIVRLLTHNGKD